LRDYEVLYIVRPDLDEAAVQKETERVTGLIKSLGGKPENTNVWGKRRLAYAVSGHQEGHYVLQDFKLETERVPELEASLKISEQVFRHIVSQRIRPAEPVRKPVAVTPQPAPAPVVDEPAAVTEEA
jgi:small subunit ribosomal protein S6